MKAQRQSDPTDWMRKPLGELFAEQDIRVRDCGIPADNVPVLSMTRDRGLVLHTEKFKNRVASRDVAAYKFVRRGQLVYSFPIDEGVIAILLRAEHGAVSPAYHVWEPREQFDSEFIDRLLRVPGTLETFRSLASNTVGRRRNLAKSDFQRVEVMFPRLSEQRAIAGVLRTVQEAKEACERVIAATRQLKHSLLAHLFTYGPVPFNQADKVGLKGTDVGSVPEHWEMDQLGENAAIGNGSTPKRTEARYWDGGTIPWLTSGKVHDGTIRAADEFVTEEARRECHLPMVPAGSLLVAITGQGKTLGNSALLAIDACISQHLAYLTFHGSRLLPEFVLAFLRSRYDQLQAVSRSGGSTKGALTCGYLKGFLVPVPPPSEQEEIAGHLSAVDAKLSAEESRRAALASLFRSLLHNLMTGRVRLPEFAR